jgi:anti-sigma B factor antagonist
MGRNEGNGANAPTGMPRHGDSDLATKGPTNMEMTDEVVGKATVLKLRGRLDAVSAISLKDRVKDFTGTGQNCLVIDMAEVDYVDSSGLGSMVACLRSVNKLGGDIRIASLQDRVRAVFELIRLHHVFEIFDAVPAAVDSFQKTMKDE